MQLRWSFINVWPSEQVHKGCFWSFQRHCPSQPPFFRLQSQVPGKAKPHLKEPQGTLPCVRTSTWHRGYCPRGHCLTLQMAWGRRLHHSPQFQAKWIHRGRLLLSKHVAQMWAGNLLRLLFQDLSDSWAYDKVLIIIQDLERGTSRANLWVWSLFPPRRHPSQLTTVMQNILHDGSKCSHSEVWSDWVAVSETQLDFKVFLKLGTLQCKFRLRQPFVSAICTMRRNIGSQ